MLGKTNIMALQEGAIVTDIADYGWMQQRIGINGSFFKAVYKNGYLIGLTEDGNIAYTTDGEVWTISKPEYNNIKLNDIEWDGSRFLIVGSYTSTDTDLKTGIILITTDFVSYELITPYDFVLNSPESKPYVQCLAIYHESGKYIVIIERSIALGSTAIYSCCGDLKTQWEFEECITTDDLHEGTFCSAKNSTGMIFSMQAPSGSDSFQNPIYRAYINAQCFLVRYNSQKKGSIIKFPVFECKDSLYAMTMGERKELLKISDTNEETILTTGINYDFSDGVYIDECQIFINKHEMLIVRKGESIGDKTLDDLIEIVPEQTMVCIEKAFGGVYIFGKQGLLLKSTNEVNNNEAITVQYLSAKQALAQSKTYTDEQISTLEARVSALEAFHQEETT